MYSFESELFLCSVILNVSKRLSSHTTPLLIILLIKVSRVVEWHDAETMWMLFLINPVTISFQRAPTAWRAQRTAGIWVWVTRGACLCGVHPLWAVLRSGCSTEWKSHPFKWPERLRRPICSAPSMIWVGSTPLISHRASLQVVLVVFIHPSPP